MVQGMLRWVGLERGERGDGGGVFVLSFSGGTLE